MGERNDHEALRALNQRYARAADDRDVDALAALFHPDAVIIGARGEQPLDAWLDGMRGPRPFPTSMHLLGDPLIALDGDTGTVDTYAIVHQLGGEGQGDMTLGIRYLDQVERSGDSWVIRFRRATTVFMR
jgi:ketosteroid isomerase-like protein